MFCSCTNMVRDPETGKTENPITVFDQDENDKPIPGTEKTVQENPPPKETKKSPPEVTPESFDAVDANPKITDQAKADLRTKGGEKVATGPAIKELVPTRKSAYGVQFGAVEDCSQLVRALLHLGYERSDLVFIARQTQGKTLYAVIWAPRNATFASSEEATATYRALPKATRNPFPAMGKNGGPIPVKLNGEPLLFLDDDWTLKEW